MIQVTNLVRKFAGVTAVDNVSFHVKRGQVAGILGLNGAGKTTTLRILSGFLAPTAGSVMIDGLNLTEHSVEIRRRIGYLPENVPLYPAMRVREYLTFRAVLKGVPRARLKERLDAVATMCGLETIFDRIIGGLSRGYWQRVGLADTLIHEPRLLILDEPTLGLDPNQIRNIRDLIRSLTDNYTVLLSTHFLNEAEMICQQALIMHLGRVIASDTPGNLIDINAAQTCLVAEIHALPDNVLPLFNLIPGVCRIAHNPVEPDSAWFRYVLNCEPQTDLRSNVFDIAKEQGWKLRELRCDRRNLEDIFNTLTAAT